MTLKDVGRGLLRCQDVCVADFEQALKKIKPTVTRRQIQEFEDWTEKFG